MYKLLNIIMAVFFSAALCLLAYCVFSHNMRYAMPAALIFLALANIARYCRQKLSGAENLPKGSFIMSFIAVAAAILMLIPM